MQVLFRPRHIGDQRVAQRRQVVAQLQHFGDLAEQAGNQRVRLDGFRHYAVDHAAYIAQREADIAQAHVRIIGGLRQLYLNDADLVAGALLAFGAQIHRHLDGDRLLQLNALILQIAVQCAVHAGQCHVVEGGAGDVADAVDALHRHRCRGKLAARGDLAGQRCVAISHERQRYRVFGELDAFQEQHGGQSAHAQQLLADIADMAPQCAEHFQAQLVGIAGIALAAMAGGPDRLQVHIVRGFAHVLCGPACHGDAVGAGVVHFLIHGKTTVFQTVNDVHFPQRFAAIQAWLVQCRNQRVQILAAVFFRVHGVEEDVLADIHRAHFFPVRHTGQRELDDAVEWCLDVGQRQVFFVQMTWEILAALARALENQQPGNVFRAGVGFGDKKCQVQQR